MQEVFKAMPDVPSLFRRAQALAVLSAIQSPEEPPYDMQVSGQYALVRRERGWKATFRQQAECIDIHFTDDAGVLLLWWIREAIFDTGCDYADDWPPLLKQVPEPLSSLMDDPETTLGYRTGGEGLPDMPMLSGVMWREPGDTSWRIPDFTYDEEIVEEGERHADCGARDNYAFMALDDLIAPLPEETWARTVREDGIAPDYDPAGITWPPSGMSPEAARRHVFELRPVTAQVIGALHPTRTLADVMPVVRATGYPLD
jgi:hypothetical protein